MNITLEKICKFIGAYFCMEDLTIK